MKAFLIRAAVFVLAVALMIAGAGFALKNSIKSYPDALALDNSITKLRGQYLIESAPDNTVYILGASELDTDYIDTYPAVFFADKDVEFTVNLIGRGSCQSINYASILAASDLPAGSKVVIILTPQPFVPEGIAPDMYFTNFSELQLDKILTSDLPTELKDYFLSRFETLFERYGESKLYSVSDIAASKFTQIVATPYTYAMRGLLGVKDLYSSYKEYEAALKSPYVNTRANEIDWAAERQAAIEQALSQSSNNDFGMYDETYTVNVGRKLQKFKNSRTDLSYLESEEYGDLELLLRVCEYKGIKPMIVMVPEHGKWADYTGFPDSERQAFYEKVRGIITSYDVVYCDFSGEEYTDYFLCDTMHLGWIGWLELDERITEFYNDAA